MTTPAVLAKTTVVDIILEMAGPAILGQGQVASLLAVTVPTPQAEVRTEQRELGLLVVVELPERPAIGVMAGFAVFT